MATAGSNSRPDFQQELLAIRQDSEVKSLARRRAGNPEAAEDPPQTAYYAVCRMANPGAIENLHAYFCSGLIREIYREPGQLGATVAEDFAHLIDMRQGRSGIGSSGHRPVPKAPGLPGCRAAARCATQVLGNLPARAVPSSGRGPRAPPFRVQGTRSCPRNRADGWLPNGPDHSTRSPQLCMKGLHVRSRQCITGRACPETARQRPLPDHRRNAP